MSCVTLDTFLMVSIMFCGSVNKKMSSTVEFCSNLPTESQFRCHYTPSPLVLYDWQRKSHQWFVYGPC